MTDMVLSAADDVIRYEELVAEFTNTLATKLRSHSISRDYLVLWVPDRDPVTSILTMIDAAEEAGRNEIFIKVGRALFADGQLDVLQEKIRDISTLRTVEGDDTITLCVHDLKPFVSTTKLSDDVTGKRRLAHVAEDATVSETEKFVTAGIKTIETALADGEESISLDLSCAPDDAARDRLREEAANRGDVLGGERNTLEVSNLKDWARFARVDASLRAGIRAHAMSLAHEGVLPDSIEGYAFEEREGSATLAVIICPSTHKVLAARHSGGETSLQQGMLEAFCAVIQGLPIQDAADYGGFKLLHLLRNRALSRPVAGIMMTVSVGTAVDMPVQLIRKIRKAYAKESGFTDTVNFYEPAPLGDWLGKSRAEQSSLVTSAIEAFNRDNGLRVDDIILNNISKNVRGYDIRIWISFSPNIAYNLKPNLTRALERWIKDRVEARLQVFNEERRDKSPLRRLTPEDIKKKMPEKKVG